MGTIFWINIFVNLFILFIQFIPLNFKAKILYDALKNKGLLQIKLFKLSLINVKFSLQQGYIEVIRKNGKIKLLPIEFSGKKSFFSETDIVTLLVKAIKVQQGTVYINFGVSSDAFLTAMVIGVSKVSTSILGSIIKSKKTQSKIKNKIYPDFKHNKLTICFKGSVKISIAQIILCFIKAFISKYILKKEQQNERWI